MKETFMESSIKIDELKKALKELALNNANEILKVHEENQQLKKEIENLKKTENFWIEQTTVVDRKAKKEIERMKSESKQRIQSLHDYTMKMREELEQQIQNKEQQLQYQKKKIEDKLKDHEKMLKDTSYCNDWESIEQVIKELKSLLESEKEDTIISKYKSPLFNLSSENSKKDKEEVK